MTLTTIGTTVDEVLALVDELDEGFVAPRFGDRAGWLVAQHVPAQRYLATVDDDVHGLHVDSRRSLRRHGGTLSAARVRTFESHPGAADAVRLRRWADAVAAGATPTIDRPTLAGRLQDAWVG